MNEDFQDTDDPDIGISVHAGFPNAAADRQGSALDFNRLLVEHPSSTYCFRVEGSAHESRGIFDGDIAVIDRALQARSSDLILLWQDEGFVLAFFDKATPSGHIWGVVTSVIHRMRS